MDREELVDPVKTMRGNFWIGEDPEGVAAALGRMGQGS